MAARRGGEDADETEVEAEVDAESDLAAGLVELGLAAVVA